MVPFYTLSIHTQKAEFLGHLAVVQLTIDWHSRYLQSKACDGSNELATHLMSQVPVPRMQELVVRPPGARCPGAQLTSHCTRSRVTSPHSRPVTARVTRSLRNEF